jgi:hypothetical protein
MGDTIGQHTCLPAKKVLKKESLMRFCPGLGCTVCGPAPGAAEPVPGGEQQGRLFRLRYSLLGNSLVVNIDSDYFVLYSAPC